MENYLSAFLWMFALLGASVHLFLQGILVWAWVKKSRTKHIYHTTKTHIPPISVIVSARNEAANLPQLLADLAVQDYPSYEILLVLDRCTDASRSIVQDFQVKYPFIRYIEIHSTPENWSPKKYALTQGIAAARNEWLAFTDADCRLSTEWLSEIAAVISAGKGATELVLGIGLYAQRGGWLNALIRYETLQTALQYIGAARLGMPYMGVGRNIAYRASFFAAADGFSAHRHRLSGDDDLLVNASAKPQHTATLIAPASISYSLPMETWRGWIRQKLRHVSAANAYSWRTKLWLLAFHWSFLAFYTGILGSLVIFPTTSLPILALYSCRSVISCSLLWFVARKVQQPDLVWRFLLLDIAFFCYTAFIVPLGLLIQPIRWRN